MQVLLAGHADPDLGNPSALESVVMFKQEGKWKEKFVAAPGKGKVAHSTNSLDLGSQRQ